MNKLNNINYENCLTNLTCSILKYFNCEYKHNTLEYIDKILEERKPKNIIYILCDGMGYNLLNRILDNNSFLVKNIKYKLLSVFPPTTTAATTSVITGLNPNEHSWLGWDIYLKQVNEVITMYLNVIKDTEIKIADENLCYKYLNYKDIFSTINKQKDCNATYLLPIYYPQYKLYTGIDEMLLKIKENMNIKSKNYIYAYYDDPDAIMHHTGTNSIETINTFKMINDKLETFCNEIDDAIIIITADHGHINNKTIYLEDYPDIFNCLIRNTSSDPRAAMYFIKEDKKIEFEKLFNDKFKEYFILMNKEDIIKTKLYGTGINHPNFEDSLGDFISIAISNKSIKYKRFENEHILLSNHAGNTDDETIVPLIIIDKK